VRLIHRCIALARTAIAAFLKPDGHLVLDASELDFYLFNRAARMDEVWGSERAGAVGRIGSDRIRPASARCLCEGKSENYLTPNSSAVGQR
jgi:predicted alpha/beta hydrolase